MIVCNANDKPDDDGQVPSEAGLAKTAASICIQSVIPACGAGLAFLILAERCKGGIIAIQ